MITLYDSGTKDFNNNGIVVLSDCKSFYTTERLNDAYEVEFEYPILNSVARLGVITPSKIVGRNKVGETGISQVPQKWVNIIEGNIVKNSDGQLFRIYHKVKTLTGIKANARHIFYDLLDNFLEDVRPTNLSGYGALDYILTHTQYAHSFTSTGDVGGSNTKYFIRKNPVEAILGNDGIIANWGGELVRDNFNIKLLQARGLDRGVLISYGKNIIGIEQTIDLDSVITRIYPTGATINNTVLTLQEKYVDSPFINSYAHPKIKEVQFSDAQDEATLRTLAQNYFTSSLCDIPIVNYKIDFIELSKTVEYENYAILETVYMGDTVTVRHKKLNMDLKCKVISIKKNDLTGRIEQVELGDFKPNFATSTNNAISAINAISDGKGGLSISALAAAVANATNLIISGNDGHVVQDENGISIMDTTDKNTATKVWRWNLNGLGYSSTGWNGPFTTAITADGHIVADFITVGHLVADIIQGGILTLGGSNNVNGSLIMLDKDGNQIGIWDNDGIHILKGKIEGTTVSAVNTVTIGTTAQYVDSKIAFQNLWDTIGASIAVSNGGDCDTMYVHVRGTSTDRAQVRFYGDDGTLYATPIDMFVPGNIHADSYTNIGKIPAATWTTTIPSGETVTIQHNLGYKPLVKFSGTLGNVQLNTHDVDDNNLEISNYNSGNNPWSGYISLY